MMNLPTLDDKPYQTLLEEAIARIPGLAENWTDRNPSDTGMLLLELCAALTEAQIYYLDQALESPYQHYLNLVCPKMEGDTLTKQAERFARQFGKDCRMVTPKDYERRIMELPLGLDGVQVEQHGAKLFITVYRKSGALSSKELLDLRRALEPGRLLTTQLKIMSACQKSVSALCRVCLKPGAGRPDECREKLHSILSCAAQKMECGKAVNFGELRSEILALPEVTHIDELSIQDEIRKESARRAKIKIEFI